MLKKLIPIIAILVIGALEAYALSKGINGAMLSVSIGLIAGIGGYTAKAKLVK